MANITYDDLFALVEEMDRGAKNKTRTISDISNLTVKDMISKESSMALSAGVTDSLLASGTAIPGALIGTIGGAGAGIVATSVTALGLGALSAVGGAAVGSVAGSVVPIVGTIVGGVVGVLIGIFAVKRRKKKNDNNKERLMQQVQSKQNTIIRDLERELDELKQKFGKAIEQNERYIYIVGVLMTNEDLKKSIIT